MARLLTVEDVYDLFRFKKSYVYHLTHRGEIPHLKIGNHVRFHQSELEAWLARQANGNGDTRQHPEQRSRRHADL